MTRSSLDMSLIGYGELTLRSWHRSARMVGQPVDWRQPGYRRCWKARLSIVPRGYGRTAAICRANGEDVGAVLLREGLAWAFVRYSDQYAADEQLAQQKKCTCPVKATVWELTKRLGS